jgi:hypothetical protein
VPHYGHGLELGYIQLLMWPAKLFDCHNLVAKMSTFSEPAADSFSLLAGAHNFQCV